MIRLACPATLPRRRIASLAQPDTAAGGPSAYGRAFWYAYAANFFTAVGVAVLIRYADFITLLGGTEIHLGWIVGIGMIGSFVMRLATGVSIDRYGPRLMWLGSILLFVATCFAHLLITSHTGVAIYLLRIAYCCSLAGIYGASITFVSGKAPLVRMAELVGILGTSGFIGFMVGTGLGDLVRGSGALQRWQLDEMFLLAGLLGLGSIPLAWLAMRGYIHPARPTAPPVLRLVRHYQPGLLLLLVVLAMGAALNLPNTFLPTYAAELAIPRIGLFFTVYSIVAVLTRVVTRHWPARLGLRPMLLVGTAGLAVSQLLFLTVNSEWQLLLPGIGYGMSHAVLFPATVAAGNRRFPEHHRGLGTTLVLAMWDVGQLVGMPAAGAILHYGAATGLPPYTALFLSTAALLTLVGGLYAAWGRPAPPARTAASSREGVETETQLVLTS
jgi:MFS family permease